MFHVINKRNASCINLLVLSINVCFEHSLLVLSIGVSFKHSLICLFLALMFV